MLRIILFLAIGVFADETPLVLGYFQANWTAAASAYDAERRAIENRNSAKGLLCSGATITEKNSTLVAITGIFLTTSMEYAFKVVSLGGTIERDASVAGLVAYNDSALALVVKRNCTQDVQPDAGTVAEINRMFGMATLDLISLTAPPTSIRRPFAPKASKSLTYFNILGRSLR